MSKNGEEKMKPILCLDFDGVIHSYESGWKGIDVIPDPPVPGAIEFIAKALEHFRVCIYSSRSGSKEGRAAMDKWLWAHCFKYMNETGNKFDFYEIEFPHTKPPAKVSIDDRAITFTGEFPDVAELVSFEPWNRRV